MEEHSEEVAGYTKMSKLIVTFDSEAHRRPRIMCCCLAYGGLAATGRTLLAYRQLFAMPVSDVAADVQPREAGC